MRRRTSRISARQMGHGRGPPVHRGERALWSHRQKAVSAGAPSSSCCPPSTYPMYGGQATALPSCTVLSLDIFCLEFTVTVTSSTESCRRESSREGTRLQMGATAGGGQGAGPGAASTAIPRPLPPLLPGGGTAPVRQGRGGGAPPGGPARPGAGQRGARPRARRARGRAPCCSCSRSALLLLGVVVAGWCELGSRPLVRGAPAVPTFQCPRAARSAAADGAGGAGRRAVGRGARLLHAG